ncbi:hypothetical protein ACTXT7_011444 [Hymenolepis weldensis]
MAFETICLTGLVDPSIGGKLLAFGSNFQICEYIRTHFTPIERKLAVREAALVRTYYHGGGGGVKDMLKELNLCERNACNFNLCSPTIVESDEVTLVITN